MLVKLNSNRYYLTSNYESYNRGDFTYKSKFNLKLCNHHLNMESRLFVEDVLRVLKEIKMEESFGYTQII